MSLVLSLFGLGLAGGAVVDEVGDLLLHSREVDCLSQPAERIVGGHVRTRGVGHADGVSPK